MLRTQVKPRRINHFPVLHRLPHRDVPILALLRNDPPVLIPIVVPRSRHQHMATRIQQRHQVLHEIRRLLHRRTATHRVLIHDVIRLDHVVMLTRQLHPRRRRLHRVLLQLRLPLYPELIVPPAHHLPVLHRRPDLRIHRPVLIRIQNGPAHTRARHRIIRTMRPHQHPNLRIPRDLPHRMRLHRYTRLQMSPRPQDQLVLLRTPIPRLQPPCQRLMQRLIQHRIPNDLRQEIPEILPSPLPMPLPLQHRIRPRIHLPHPPPPINPQLP